MRALLGLSVRFARAEGWIRLGVLVATHAVTAVVVLLSLTLPDSILAAPSSVNERLTRTLWLAPIVVPVVVLTVTVGGASAARRDRRLAALRLLGLGAARTRLVTAVAHGLPAAVGAVLGALIAARAALVVDRAASGRGWFVEPLRVSPGEAAVVVLGVTALAVAGVLVSSRQPFVARDVTPARTGRAQRPWPLVALLVGVAAVAWIGWTSSAPLWLGAVAGIALAVAVAGLPGLVGAWVARALVRSRSVPAVLAGRALEAEPAGSSRLVAGVGTMLFLGTVVLGYVGSGLGVGYPVWQQAATTGPQVAHAFVASSGVDGTTDRTLPGEFVPSRLEALRQVDGVLAVRPLIFVTGQRCDGAECPEVFVGTCAELAQEMSVAGCDDSRAAVITRSDGVDTSPPFARVVAGGLVALTSVDRDIELDLAGVPLVQDVAATSARWVYPSSYGLFIPRHLLGDELPATGVASVIVDGGPELLARVATAASGLGITVEGTGDPWYEEVVALRGLSLKVLALLLAIGLTGVVAVALERARERRRVVGRLVALGVPARVLRVAQVWQTLVPLLVAIVAGLGCGVLMVEVVEVWRQADIDALTDAWLPLVVMAVAGVAVVTISTLPAATARLTPDLLREK